MSTDEHWFIVVVSHSMLSSTQVPLGQRHIRAKSPRASDVQTSVELNRAACDKGQPKCFFVFVVLYLLHVNTHICMYILSIYIHNIIMYIYIYKPIITCIPYLGTKNNLQNHCFCCSFGTAPRTLHRPSCLDMHRM